MRLVVVFPAEGAQRFEQQVGHGAHHEAERSRRRRTRSRIARPIRPTSNTPLTAAAMANWKPTMPEASLNNDSPFSTLVWRSVSAASLAERRHRDRIGRPERRHRAPKRRGERNRRPDGVQRETDRHHGRDRQTDRQRQRQFDGSAAAPVLSISCASKYSSGAMNSTMNSSGLSVTSGKERQLRCQRAQRDLHKRR